MTGVDSMVLSRVLSLLQKSGRITNVLAVVAMHIDYANRPESGREADYVEQWCQAIDIVFRKVIIFFIYQ